MPHLDTLFQRFKPGHGFSARSHAASRRAPVLLPHARVRMYDGEWRNVNTSYDKLSGRERVREWESSDEGVGPPLNRACPRYTASRARSRTRVCMRAPGMHRKALVCVRAQQPHFGRARLRQCMEWGRMQGLASAPDASSERPTRHHAQTSLHMTLALTTRLACRASKHAIDATAPLQGLRGGARKEIFERQQL
jgi:hypothetical protein